MRIAMAGATGNIGGATHKQLRPTRRERPTGFSLDSLLVSVPVVMAVAVVVGLLGGLVDNRPSRWFKK
jgi:hypothetical protein